MALLRNGSVTARNIACITFATRYVLRETSSRGTGIHVTQDKPEYHGRGRCGADLARSAAQPDRHGRPHAKPGCALPRHGSAVRRRTAERSRVAREPPPRCLPRFLSRPHRCRRFRRSRLPTWWKVCRRRRHRTRLRYCRRLRVRQSRRREVEVLRRRLRLGPRHRCREPRLRRSRLRSTLPSSRLALDVGFLLCQAFRFTCPARFRCRTIWCAKAPPGRRHRPDGLPGHQSGGDLQVGNECVERLLAVLGRSTQYRRRMRGGDQCGVDIEVGCCVDR